MTYQCDGFLHANKFLPRSDLQRIRFAELVEAPVPSGVPQEYDTLIGLELGSMSNVDVASKFNDEIFVYSICRRRSSQPQNTLDMFGSAQLLYFFAIPPSGSW